MDKDEKRLHRLLEILTIIQGGGSATANDLAHRFGISRRTLFRDLDDLKAAGVPIAWDDHERRYRIHGDFFLPPINLSLEEALSLCCVVQHVAANDGVPFAQPACRAIEKVRTRLPGAIRHHLLHMEERFRVQLAANSPPDGVADVYALVRKAIATCRQLECIYESAGTAGESDPFHFSPFCLFFGQRAWYAIGYHHGHGEIRKLKLNRFTDIDLTDRPFAVPGDFSLDGYLGQAWRMIRGEQRYHIHLHFDAEFADNITETHWHDTQQTQINSDGSADFYCEVDGLDEIVWWVLSMGPHCRVIHPMELAERVVELATSTARQYESASPKRRLKAAR